MTSLELEQSDCDHADCVTHCAATCDSLSSCGAAGIYVDLNGAAKCDLIDSGHLEGAELNTDDVVHQWYCYKKDTPGIASRMVVEFWSLYFGVFCFTFRSSILVMSILASLISNLVAPFL